MRLLTVGSLPPEWGGTARGGVATFHASLLAGLLSGKHAVEVVGVMATTPDSAMPARATAAGPPDRNAATLLPIFSPPAGANVGGFYADLLERLEPDAVLMNHVAHAVGATHARLGSPVPAIGVAHSWRRIASGSDVDRQHGRALAEEALSGLGTLVAPSRHCLEEGEALGLRYPATTAIVHHPLQPLYLADDVDVRAFERRGVACLGGLTEGKNTAALVEAVALLGDLELVLAGEGELEGALRDQVAELSLGNRVRLAALPDLDHLRRVQDLLLRSQLMCLPSRGESFGLAYIEALACGTPIVGFGPVVREIRDAMGIEIGEPLDEGTPGEIAAAIERVASTSWDRAALRRAAVRTFDLAATTDRYVELLRDVGAPSTVGPPARRDARHVAPQAAGKSTAVCVLGMSRSGTSLTTRMLNLADVYLGPEDDLLQPAADNPDGFWEHSGLTHLNERVLRSLGGSWSDPPILAPGWETSDELAAERREAQALLDETFGGRQLWGWKDPRSCLTLPFWQQLVPRMRYVICLRNPVDVAASLERRNGLPPERSFTLWLAYVAGALVNTSGRPRILVSYEDYFDDWRGTAERLSRFVGRSLPRDGGDEERRLRETIDERLWHHRTSTGDVLRDARVPAEVASLHMTTQLLRAAAPESAPHDARSRGLHEAADMLARRLVEQQAEVSEDALRRPARAPREPARPG